MEISLKAGASLSSAQLQSFCYDSAAAAGEDDGQRDDSRKGFIQEKKWRDKLQWEFLNTSVQYDRLAADSALV